MSEMKTGQIGNFGGINVFTDCAFEIGKTVITGSAIKTITTNMGKPHTCPENQRCSRWILEQGPGVQTKDPG